MDSKTSRIAELATIIQESTLKIDEYLHSQVKASPSTRHDCPPVLDLPEDLAATRTTVIHATEELNYLMLGPLQYLTTVTGALNVSIHALYKYPIATSFPVGERTTFAAIAGAIGLNEEMTTRLVRLLITYRVFGEPVKGVVEHTALSAFIATKPGIHDYIGLISEESWWAMSRVVDAIHRWDDSEDTTRTGYNIATGCTVPFFDGLKADPGRAKRFDATMSFVHSGSGGYERALLCESYDWPQHKGAVVVDMGGNRGDMCIDLARRYPYMKLINQDLPDVIASVPPLPEDVRDRVGLMVHDFFSEQPVKGADVYLFRWIFHDWADVKAVQILNALLPALKSGSRLVIGDVCIPEPNTIPLYEERRLRGFDMHMKAVLNALERDTDQWRRLFAKIDPKLHFLGVKRHPKSQWAVMECIWTG